MKHLIPLAALWVSAICSAHAGQRVTVPVGHTVTAPSSYERKLVAAVLVLEAGGDGTRGMEAVMHVIDNRCRSRSLSPQRVVSQRGQFSTMARGAASAVTRGSMDSATYSKALAVYDRWKAGALGWDPTLGALYFESFRRTPRSWRKFKITAHIGGHKFYRP